MKRDTARALFNGKIKEHLFERAARAWRRRRNVSFQNQWGECIPFIHREKVYYRVDVYAFDHKMGTYVYSPHGDRLRYDHGKRMIP